MALYDDTLELLRVMIRNACVNDLTDDSGGEARTADTLEEFFADAPVTVQRIEPHPGRRSLVVTVPGSVPDAEPLTLLGHTDVVPADRDRWSVDPFAATIRGDTLVGRGAVDMLFITASMAAVTRQLAREGGGRGTLAFAALADEEARGGLGARWLAEHQPQAFSWANTLSETGGSHLRPADGSDAITVTIGEKGAAQRRLTVHGDAGHGSAPFGRRSAIAAIAEVARRIAALRTPLAEDDTWQGFVTAFRFDPVTERALLTEPDADYSVFGELAGYAHAVSHTTIAETVLRAGGPINVMPSRASLELDIRPLPGATQEEIDELLRGALGDMADKVEIKHLLTEPATVSPTAGPLWEAIIRTIEEEFPGVPVVPVLSTGGSDLRFARRRGGVGYGFALHAPGRSLADVTNQLHAHDEQLHLEDLRLTVGAYDRLVRRFLGAGGPLLG